MKKLAGNQKLVRTTNQSLIIETVRKSGQISRAELAKALNLSAPSVSNNIDMLLKQNILKEIGEGQSIGGRKPILLEFNNEYGYIIAIDLSGEDIRIVLGDLSGTVLEVNHFNEGLIRKTSLDHLIKVIHQFLDIRKITRDSLLAVCIGTPGVIDQQTGYFQLAPRFENWQNINLKELIKSEFDTEVIVKNDINLAVIGESLYGAGRGFKSLVYISVDFGIGSGIMINHSLYEGKRLAAGDIGYWITCLDDIKEANRKPSVLDSQVTVLALINRAKEDIRSGVKSQLLYLANENVEKITFDLFKKAVMDGDEYCISITRDAAVSLGWAVANISILLDLELVVIGGEITQLGYNFIQPLRATVAQLTPLSTTVVFSELGDKAVIYGAFAEALDYVLKNIVE